MGSVLSMEERKRLCWIQIPRDGRAPWSIFAPMFRLSSSISWIKLSSSLSLIPVYLSVFSNSCLFVRSVRSDTHKISAIFFHVNAKSLKPSSSSQCISYLGLPCLHVPIISKRRWSSLILLLRKLSTSCIPRKKSAGKSNLYTICAKKLFKKVILLMLFSIALSNVTKLSKLALSWSDFFIRSRISGIVLFLQMHRLTD